MADTSKSQKLASARKKFKELKKKKNAATKAGEERNTAEVNKEDTLADSLTSSTHSSINEQGVSSEHSYTADNFQQNVLHNTKTSQLPNYFNINVPEPSSFFDNITSKADSQNENREKNQTDSGMFNNPISCDDTNVNTFNRYSFQYDTPFHEVNVVPQQEIKTEAITGSQNVENYFHSSNDMVGVDTYFSKNLENNLEDGHFEEDKNPNLSDTSQQQIKKDLSPDKDTKDLIEYMGNKEKELEEQYSSMTQDDTQYYPQQNTSDSGTEEHNRENKLEHYGLVIQEDTKCYPQQSTFDSGTVQSQSVDQGQNKEKKLEHYGLVMQEDTQSYPQRSTFDSGTVQNQSVDQINPQSDFFQGSPFPQIEASSAENMSLKIEPFQPEIYDPQNELQNMQNLVHNQMSEFSNKQSNSNKVYSNASQMKIEEVPSQSISSVESLLQLSNQMAKLIEPGTEYAGSEISELEKRNLELAAELEKERLKSEQLSASINEYQCRIAELETELKNRIAESNIIENNTFTRLKEELQSHIQTIGMLVAEKTEISANASQFELLAKQKTTECEELQNRLKASRSRVSDLEKENSNFKEELSTYRNMEGEQSQQVNKMNEEFKKLKEEKEELFQDLLEAREKLKTTSESNLNLQKQVQELNSHLSLANIKIQQLTTTENQHVDAQVEKLVQEKFALEKQVADLTQTLHTLMKEKDDSSTQYQQYTQQLNTQLTSLAKKLEQLQHENEVLVTQEQNRIKHIGELERQLQNLQNDHINYSGQRSNGDYKKEYLLALDNFQTVQAKKAELDESYTKLSNEKEMLLRDLESKKHTISHLEDLVEQLRENQPDNTKLVAAMESDKVAAARAMSQNIELKKQLEGMQEVLMKLNNDKLELTEKLTKETKINEEIMDDLQKTKLHLGTLADAIEIKDKELSSLRNNCEELNKHLLQQGQLTDRLRHYEAQNYSSHALQEELQEAKNTIAKLSFELENLKSNRPSNYQVTSRDATTLTLESENNADKVYNEKKDTDSLVINDLQEKLSKLELKNKELEEQLRKVKEPDIVDHDKSEQHPTHKNGEMTVLDKEAAMKHLEEKFLHTMDEIARLTDEKQKLEHLVLQLQGETETIGEYVALYQHQRSVLKQKALEKDLQLKQLTQDRAQIKNKLDQLNMLVKKLVNEKGTITSELLQHHEQLKNESHQLCEEHSKIHKELNKITEARLNPNTDQHVNPNTETAEKIIELLTEIKTSNLVQPTENFHHCPWCSGQLITV